ncbi:Histidine kinase [Lysobacter dokdonensis DS-58]|uniref:Oxygen sensor histidine kinase NreB n=1 Tax=Lysobacter dokdonensis DS-58 TaxID=1300345 RepID=A0A0A2WK09_9GAMM|nr:sensor histidine kinase [Lysobacter dokdonensis]KGQ18585.1 Histidine kinase [Lysobacter dokdonensis DS-58]
MTSNDSIDTADLLAQYQRLLERVETNEKEFRRLARSVSRVEEDERRRLARDLHDGLGQTLTALKHRLVQLGDGLPGESRERLDAAIALCGEALEDTRTLSRLLRPPILDDLGLEAALRALARSLGESSGMTIDVDIGELPPLDGDVQTLLFRVAQEALNNAAKHAHASEVLVRLVSRGGFLQLQVADDGVGCDPDRMVASGGSGLGGMRERLRLYGGQMEMHSSAGEGTRLRALVPTGA